MNLKILSLFAKYNIHNIVGTIFLKVIKIYLCCFRHVKIYIFSLIIVITINFHKKQNILDFLIP